MCGEGYAQCWTDMLVVYVGGEIEKQTGLSLLFNISWVHMSNTEQEANWWYCITQQKVTTLLNKIKLSGFLALLDWALCGLYNLSFYAFVM